MRLYRRHQKMPDGTKRVWGPWWIQFHQRGRLVRVSLKTRDKRCAEIAAGEMLKKAELRSVGVFDPHEKQRLRPIDDHLTEFEDVLRARDVVTKYREERMRLLRAFVEWAHLQRLGDLDVADATRWVNELAKTGIAARTLNSRIEALKAFGNWARTTHRLPFDPFSTLEKRNEATDQRHVRRALRPEEVARLVAAARTGPVDRARRFAKRHGLTPAYEARLRRWGEGHALVYALAVATGLRAGEMKRLTWADVDLERGRARVTARSAKSRCEQSVQLHETIVATLRAAKPATALPSATVIPTGCFPTIRTFDEDLAAAKIAKHDGEGRVVDRHALRHTFVSSLAAANVHPRVAQALARHSSIELTMKAYTDVSLLDLKGAVARIAGTADGAAKGKATAG